MNILNRARSLYDMNVAWFLSVYAINLADAFVWVSNSPTMILSLKHGDQDVIGCEGERDGQLEWRLWVYSTRRGNCWASPPP